MNLSLNWLNEYVNVSAIPLKDLAAGLTMSGTKAEKYKDLAEPLDKIVVGKVTEIKKHEDSDKLWICTVCVGYREGETPGEAGSRAEALCRIVTGAQNVTQGAIVPVVLDGGTVLNRADGTPMKIKKGKLRGAVSEGMLCSHDELGLDVADVPYAVDGILILSDDPAAKENPDSLKPGDCALEFLGLKDSVIEFEITNNRPDCLSVIGLARETAATFDLPLNLPKPQYKGVAWDINAELSVTVENTQLCSRYMAGIVRGVKIAPSPRWLTSRLKAHGIRPINNIVDITNYVMLEYGQPLHAFDRRHIGGNKIVVRNAKDGEEITLLDGNTVTLDGDTLVIADSAKPLAVAGVMGGEFSGIADDTAEVVFEAARFDKATVRRAAKKIGRRTESSARFEKGLNPQNTPDALLRALELVELLGAGEVADTIINSCHFPASSDVMIPHDYEQINRFLGANISKEEQLAVFRRLGLQSASVAGYSQGANTDSCVVVPPYRSDLALPCDLAEEVARIYGYNRIESAVPRITPPQRLSANTGENAARESAMNRLAAVLTAQGCFECITYSFVSPKMNRISGSEPEGEVALKNPFGDETGVMRVSMLPSMLRVVSDNLRHRNTGARFFEIGRTYAPNKETDTLCVAMYGKNADFYALKGIVEEIAESFGINPDFTRHTEPPFHPGRAARCVFGVFGEISPVTLDEYGIGERVCAAEIDIERLIGVADNRKTYAPLPKFPAIERDLSLVCPESAESGEVVAAIRKHCKGSLFESVEFFDLFPLDGGLKSPSYKLTFRNTNGTLTNEEVDKVIEKLLAKLNEQGIKLRT